MIGNNPKSMWWNNEIKAALRRKEADWKEVLVASDEEAKERCMEVYREEMRKVKRCIIQSKNKVSEQFRRKMNEDVNGNSKLVWKEVNNVKGRKVESCSRIKDGNYYYYSGSISQQAALQALHHRGRQRRVKDQT